MADKKNKKDKTSNADGGNDGAALILDYLRKQNRPYSAIDISANLHNKVTKGAAAKVLKELHQRKEIEARVSGKQTVYHALQETSNDASPEAMTALQNEHQRLQEELTTLKENEKQAREELAALNARPLLSELRRDIDQLEQEKKSLLVQLEQFHGGDEQEQVSADERTEIERQWRYWQRQARIRGRICRDLWLRCSEVLPDNMTAEELWESLGLEGPCLC
ncbi:hypothetical protein HFD88_005640 [Aspergillus terreus]|nr:hypothetical protein HFD88_005640 [Aspergillus terreus]